MIHIFQFYPILTCVFLCRESLFPKSFVFKSTFSLPILLQTHSAVSHFFALDAVSCSSDLRSTTEFCFFRRTQSVTSSKHTLNYSVHLCAAKWASGTLCWLLVFVIPDCGEHLLIVKLLKLKLCLSVIAEIVAVSTFRSPCSLWLPFLKLWLLDVYITHMVLLVVHYYPVYRGLSLIHVINRADEWIFTCFFVWQMLLMINLLCFRMVLSSLSWSDSDWALIWFFEYLLRESVLLLTLMFVI